MPPEPDINLYDKLLDLGVRLGSAESQATSAVRAIEIHTADCAEFRGTILERIENNRLQAQERHDLLVTQLREFGESQQKILLNVGMAIIGLLISGVGALVMLMLNIWMSGTR